MTISYNDNIPDAPNNPSVDQPKMKVNTNAIDQILAVDHISFNTAGGGQHKQVTFNGFNVPGAQTSPASTLYTNLTIADAQGQLFWRNQDSIYHVSPIRAWGVFPGAAPVITQSFNVASIVRNSAGNYTVTLNANVVASSNYGVILSCSFSGSGAVVQYVITSATTFDIRASLSASIGPTPTDPTTITFEVLQL